MALFVLVLEDYGTGETQYNIIYYLNSDRAKIVFLERCPTSVVASALFLSESCMNVFRSKKSMLESILKHIYVEGGHSYLGNKPYK